MQGKVGTHRVEETLPGGGQQNTFFDFVGPSLVNLWQSSEEYSMLPTVSMDISVQGAV